jgi:phosphomannomutase
MVGGSFSVVVRPSGTEPKLKCYLEARLPPPDIANVSSAGEEARSVLRRLRTDLANALGVSAAI